MAGAAAAVPGAEAGATQARNDTYSAAIVDHYENPRNVGSFDRGEPGIGIGVVGTPASGEVMKLQIKVDPASGRIADVRFKAYGSGPAIAACSLLTEWVKGKTLEQAAALKNDQIAQELELPPAKIHCAIAAEDVLRAAIADYRQRIAASGTMRQAKE
ncbi:MAG: iron-sulfur cluster assembly scaffold protein [Proteobacteria bacterium]|nr:iron-sulfur cluster assembly scaffold protein [Pseudomonadota bacterium]